MCAIAGIVGRLDEKNREALGRMARAMAHRGPDAEGVWVGQADAMGRGCMLAHRRLAILDLSPGGNQPMVDGPSGQVIVFNGEIYNYRQLRERMGQAAGHLQSTGDTAVMLRLLAREGHCAVKKLRGMFAFGLWDEQTRRLVLGRDPLGIKPLYVCRNPQAKGTWDWVFASEVRAIVASGLLGRPRLNPAAVAGVVWNGFVLGPETVVEGVESLRPGEVRVIDLAGDESHEYWSLEDRPGEATEERDVAEALEESVRLHLESDVPLGVFLSGGIDSSAVANLAQQAAGGGINTFTLGVDDPDLDESENARRIARAIGTSHHEIRLGEEKFVANLDRAMDSLDQPTFDGLNSFYMSQAVKEAGLTVALVGTGGDELFGGYRSFRELPALCRWQWRTRWVPMALKRAGANVLSGLMHGPGVGRQTRWAKLPEMIGAGEEMIRLYQLAYSLFLPEFQGELMREKLEEGRMVAGMPGELWDRLERETRGRSALSAVGVLEQRCFLGERLLRDTDAASMSVSLEVRLPLVDQELVEKVNRLPDAVRYRPVGRKRLLRKAGLKGLDEKLFEGRKRGFVLPYDRWIRQGLGKAIDEMMRDERSAEAVGLNGKAVGKLWEAFKAGNAGLYWSRVWGVYVLMRWGERNGVVR